MHLQGARAQLCPGSASKYEFSYVKNKILEMYAYAHDDIMQHLLLFLLTTIAGNCPFLPRRKRKDDSKCQSQLSMDTVGFGVILMSGLWTTGKEGLCFNALPPVIGPSLLICCPRQMPAWLKSKALLKEQSAIAVPVSCTDGYQFHTEKLWSCSCTSHLHIMYFTNLPSATHLMAFEQKVGLVFLLAKQKFCCIFHVFKSVDKACQHSPRNIASNTEPGALKKLFLLLWKSIGNEYVSIWQQSKKVVFLFLCKAIDFFNLHTKEILTASKTAVGKMKNR